MTFIRKNKLLIIVPILWITWAIRAWNIMALPIFVDESLHILRAQIVFDFTDATASILPGKLLLYYYLGLFDPQDVGGAWLSRQAVALCAPLGAALTYRLAVMLSKRNITGLIALVLYASLPFLLFFERMALADSFAMVWGLGLAIASLKFAKQPTSRMAILVGVLLGASFLAKLTSLPWIIIPLAAVFLFGNIEKIKRQHIMQIVATMGLMLAIPIGYIFYQEVAQVEEKSEVVTTTLYVPEEQSRAEQIWHNLEVYLEANLIMLTVPIFIALLTFIVWQLYAQRKTTLFLLLMTLSVWGFILVASARPSTRYLVVGVPPLIIILAMGFTRLIDRLQDDRVSLVSAIFALILIAGTAINGFQFAVDSWEDPTRLSLSDRDTWEYYQNSATGYALDQAAQDIPDLTVLSNGEINVVGFVSPCHTLRLYLPENENINIQCPYFKWREEFTADTIVEWEQKLDEAGEWYILADAEQPIDLMSSFDWQWRVIEVYERPFDGITTTLYYVQPAN